jgi:hypothetical protein
MSLLTENKFIGTWRLVSFTSEMEDGLVDHPYGKKPAGYIMYSTEGFVQVAIMNEDFPQDEVRPAWVFDYFSYCGRYEVHEKIVTHHMDIASVPTWAGGKQERGYQFLDDGKLLLTTNKPITILDKTTLSTNAVWERV